MVEPSPLSLHADKRARYWFRLWYSQHIAPLRISPTSAPQDHLGITGVLINVTMRLQNSLDPPLYFISVHHNINKETKGLDCLPPKDQRVILVTITSDSIQILLDLPLSIHRFLNARNIPAINADCDITYEGTNLFLLESFY